MLSKDIKDGKSCTMLVLTRNLDLQLIKRRAKTRNQAIKIARNR